MIPIREALATLDQRRIDPDDMAFQNDVAWFEANPDRIFRGRRIFREELNDCPARDQDFGLVRVIVCRNQGKPQPQDPLFVRGAVILHESDLGADLPDSDEWLSKAFLQMHQLSQRLRMN